MIPDALASDRVVAVTLGFGAERTDHLRVAADAAFADVDVATFQLQGGIGLHAVDRVVGHVLEEQRHDLHQAADAHGQDHEQRQEADVLLEFLVLFHQWAPCGICAAASYSAGSEALAVRQVFQAIRNMPLRKMAPPMTRTTKPG
ncbi:hypothetical protein D9M71_716200 [compost metagenome]